MPGDTPPTLMLLGGAGGAGTAIAAHAPDSARLVLVDFDRVARHNLRAAPLLAVSDVGAFKVHAVAAKLLPGRPAPIIPVPLALQDLRLGLFRLAKVAIAAFDNRLADLLWSRFCQAAGVPAMASVKLAGGDSPAGRLRYFTSDGDLCEQCWWSTEEFTQIAKLGRGCSQAIASGPSITDGRGARLLAELLTAEILHPLTAGLSPALVPGSELRLLDEGQTLVLHALPKADCPGLHGPIPMAIALTGDVLTYRVADLVEDLNATQGLGWRWHLPAEMMTCALAHRCGVAPSAADLAPLADRRLAELWPAGDLIQIQRASGEVIWAGLPLKHLLDWLQAHTDSGGHRL